MSFDSCGGGLNVVSVSHKRAIMGHCWNYIPHDLIHNLHFNYSYTLGDLICYVLPWPAQLVGPGFKAAFDTAQRLCSASIHHHHPFVCNRGGGKVQERHNALILPRTAAPWGRDTEGIRKWDARATHVSLDQPF